MRQDDVPQRACDARTGTVLKSLLLDTFHWLSITVVYASLLTMAADKSHQLIP